MDANIKGALAQIRRSWRAFSHNGKPLAYAEVKAILQYGLSKGYTSTSEIKDEEIEIVLRRLRE